MDTGKLITPAYDATSFEADGVLYTATESLSVARYKVFQKRNVELGFNGTFKGICTELDRAWEALEKNQLGTSAKVLGNLRDGITFAGHGRISGLEICGLFFNSDEESAVSYDHQAMLAKLQKWEDAGISVDFFFVQAAQRVSGFYERFTQSSLEAAASPLP